MRTAHAARHSIDLVVAMELGHTRPDAFDNSCKVDTRDCRKRLTRMRGLFSKPLRPSARHLFEIFRRLEWGNLLEILSCALVPQSKAPSPKQKSVLPQRFVILPCPWRQRITRELRLFAQIARRRAQLNKALADLEWK